eukprot:1488896-Pleurochrysis_carterae.AAC.4
MSTRCAAASSSSGNSWLGRACGRRARRRALFEWSYRAGRRRDFDRKKGTQCRWSCSVWYESEFDELGQELGDRRSRFVEG